MCSKCSCSNNSCNSCRNNFNAFNNSASSFNGYNGLNGGGYSSSNFSNSGMSYGNAYVPNQTLNTVFSPMEGLSNGTMFPELVRPYCPGQSLEIMNYLKYSDRGGCCR